MPELKIGRLRGGFCVYWEAEGTRRRYQLKARTRKDAEAEARDVYLAKTAHVRVLTVADIWEAYVEFLGKKPTAYTMWCTGKSVLRHFGSLRPDQVKIADSREYCSSRLAAGRKVGSIHTELGHLRSALSWAEKTGLIPRAPYIEKPPKPDSNIRPLSDEEIDALLDNCISPHIRLAVILLLTTGARVGAVLDLTWDRVDFQNRVINLRLPDGVTRKGRAVVPINRLAFAALQGAYDARLSDYVVEYAGDRVKSIRNGYFAALTRAGIEGVTIHQLRHTAAVRLLAAGVPLEKVSQYLGHTNPAVTYKVYARFLPEHLADAAEVLNFGRFNEPTSTLRLLRN